MSVPEEEQRVVHEEYRITSLSIEPQKVALVSEIQFNLICELTLRREFYRSTPEGERVNNTHVGRLVLKEVDLHTVQGLLREFQLNGGWIKYSLELL
jgi:hypothetical protein